MAIDINLANCTAWITGGASGIGAAIVGALANAGARIVSLDRSYGASAGQADSGPGPGIARVYLDLGDPKSIQWTAAELIRNGFAPDILVNNAGITHDAPIWKLSPQDWSEVLDVNLSAPFHLIRAVVPHLRERRGGTIVNIASINGLRGKFGQANYAASKAGLIALTRTLARELGGRGIRVNAVAPGMIETPMTATLPAEVRDNAQRESALGRMGRPEDVANAVLFLVSPLAAHVTGHVLVVDGGQIA